jgi:excinuclease ABC subunit B
MPDFQLVAPFEATGDQPQAIERLSAGLGRGMRNQTLLGATGTGKTFTIARVIERQNRPTLVLAHNKTLAAQLYAEFREFFPENAVEYFVSYFDYYQPEAYLPRSDTYIEKDSSRNDEIDRLRHAATHALFERRDVIIVASVSCIYGLGAPVDYGATVLKLREGGRYRRDAVLRHLVDLQYQRNDQALTRARFRVRGDTLELQPASEERLVRVEFFGDEVERITELDPLTGELLAERREVNVYPATHFVTPADKMAAAIVDIEAEMEQRVGELEAEGRALEAARLRQRTTFDLEMMRELGFCSGIENYSRHLARRDAGSRPWTLLDYFPPDWLLVVDESHMTIPQVVGMYKNDRTRKEILVDFGFRLPSALDNRPLTFEEFEATVNQAIYMSATPGPYELERSEQIAEQLIRPTGIVDPAISVRPTEGQIDDLLEEIRVRVDRGERAIVTTLTKKMAEDLADYLRELGVKVQYLHSEVDTLERVAILRDLRMGVYDVIVGINLLREGIDLPEVTLVAILDADREGFLRSAWSLIQMIGRAARNVGGEVVMYADSVTESMRAAIDETNRRRGIQETFNRDHGIEPQTIVKAITTSTIACGRSPSRRLCTRPSGSSSSSARSPRRTRSPSRSSSPRWRPRCGQRPRSSSSSGRRPSVTRSSRSGCASSSRTSRSWSRAPRSGRRPTPAGARERSRPGQAGATAARHRPSRSPRSRCCPPSRSSRSASGSMPRPPMVGRPSTAGQRPPTGFRASATSTRTRGAGRPSGWTVQPGIERSPRTSGDGPASGRVGGGAPAADGGSGSTGRVAVSAPCLMGHHRAAGSHPSGEPPATNQSREQPNRGAHACPPLPMP